MIHGSGQILLFADDGAIVANSAEDLQRMLNALHVFCSKRRLLVNVDKTEVLVFLDYAGLWNEHLFLYNNMRLRVVKQFKYLGIMFDRARGHDSMI